MPKKLFTSFFFLLTVTAVVSQSDWPYDFLKGSVAIQIDPLEEKILGKVRYKLTSISPVDSIYLDARDLEIDEVRFNGKSVAYNYEGDKVIIRKSLKPGKRYRLELKYSAQPKQAVYFLGWKDSIAGNEQIWTQGQGKYTSHWVPSPDDMREKIVFDLTITFDPRYEVIANGKLHKTNTLNGLKRWKYRMTKPMSSYLLAFAIGDYTYRATKSRSNIPILLYISRKDQPLSETTYRHTEAIFSFLESELGIPYPWQNYKQVPVRDFLYAGMENTGLTIFSDGYVVDSAAVKDLNYVNVNAHELAHQWFGNLVTETDAGQHWLHEGLATFYAYLTEKEIFGEDYYYWKLWDTAQQLKQQEERGEGEALNDPGAGSLTFYEKGAWAALFLREKLGAETFRKGIQGYLKKYAFENATLSDFFELMERECKCSLEEFFKKWFISASFAYAQCEDYLNKNNSSIRMFLKLQRELTVSPESNEVIIGKYWDEFTDPELKGRIIKRYAKSLSEDFFVKAIREGSSEVRQAVSMSITSVSPELRAAFELLLGDSSYITRENALYKLWVSFPDKRHQYLEITRGILGMPNKSFRLTWLLLALLTPDFGEPMTKAQWQRELRDYTAPYNSFEVRQNAFILIHDVLGLNDENLRHLAQASVHHVWQFRNFARTLLKELLKDQVYRVRFQAMLDKLGPKEQDYLKNSLGI